MPFTLTSRYNVTLHMCKHGGPYVSRPRRIACLELLWGYGVTPNDVTFSSKRKAALVNRCGYSLQQSTQRFKTKLIKVRCFQKLIDTETVATEVLVSATAHSEGYVRTLAIR